MLTELKDSVENDTEYSFGVAILTDWKHLITEVRAVSLESGENHD